MVHLNDVHHVYRPHIKYYREFGDRGIRELHENVRYQETLKRTATRFIPDDTRLIKIASV